MTGKRNQLSFLLLAGCAYFALVGLAHTFGIHIPGIYVFFDVPSLKFQDQIIGLLAFGWATWLWDVASRARKRELRTLRPILAAGWISVVLLAKTAAFTELAGGSSERWVYFLPVLALICYLLALEWSQRELIRGNRNSHS